MFSVCCRFKSCYLQFVVSLVITGLMTAMASTSFSEEQPTAQLSELRYGVALYEYFQGDMLAALCELEWAQQQSSEVARDEQAMLLKGAMSLAFGMDRSGARILKQTLAGSSAEKIHNVAWFYMAQAYSRRGDWPAAAFSLSKLRDPLESWMQQAVQAMRIDAAIRVGNLVLASSLLQDNVDADIWQPYGYYNLGVAHLRAQQFKQGIAYLDELALMELTTAEHLAIQDKGQTVAAYSMIERGDYSKAVDRFSLVRKQSPIAEQALLGYGWAASATGDYGQALAVWTVLAEGSPRLAVVQEAILAVPYAYEELGSAATALQYYSDADLTFTAELDRLQVLKSKFDLQSFLSMAVYDPGASAIGPMSDQQTYTLNGWDMAALHSSDTVFIERVQHFSQIEQLEKSERLWSAVAEESSGQVLAGATIDGDYAGLVELLSSDLFQSYLQDFRDLQALEKMLQGWQRKIDVYRSMIAGDNDSSQQAQIQLSEVGLQKQIDSLEKRLEQQTQALDASLAETESELRRMVLDQLDQQYKQLQRLQGQARLARARLYDQAQREASR